VRSKSQLAPGRNPLLSAALSTVLYFRPMDMIAARKEALKYLAEHSVGRQGEIANAVGLRRETLNRYAGGHAIPTDLETVQKIINWMVSDIRKNNGGSLKK
jgi:hypothetical protein